MRRVLKAIVALILAAFVLAVGTAQVRHRIAYGHFVPVGLHADVTSYTADIGIPGISKSYDAHITNFGILPRTIERCEFTTDASSHDVSIGYRLQQWNKSAGLWQTVLDASNGYCQPCPLGIAQATLVSKRLWPTQTLSTGSEATGARGNLKGETMRFVIVANRREYPTSGFVIDEQVEGVDFGYRVRH